MQPPSSETSSFAVLETPHSITRPVQPKGFLQNNVYPLPPTGNLIDCSQMRSAVTPTVDHFSGRYTQTDVASTTYSSSANQHSWTEAYQNIPSTRNLLKRLKDGQNCDPYVLSDDGLLYAYVPEPNSDLEVSRLVPPEGSIRDRLLRDAKRQLRVSPSAADLAKKMVNSLSENYWWEDMEQDIFRAASQDDEEMSYYGP